MTTFNVQTARNVEALGYYMFDETAHDGSDRRYIATDGVGMSRETWREDYRRWMSSKNKRDVKAFTALYSFAADEVDLDDPYSIEQAMSRVKEAEQQRAPGAPFVMAGQVDGKSGLFHVHTMTLNTLMHDVEIHTRHKGGAPKVERGKAGGALPPAARGVMRGRAVLDEVLARHGYDNESLMLSRKGPAWKDYAVAMVDYVVAQPDVKTAEDIMSKLEAEGFEPSRRGAKRPTLSIRVRGENGQHYMRRVNNLVDKTRAPEYMLDALAERAAAPNKRYVPRPKPWFEAAEPETAPIVESAAEQFDRLMKENEANADARIEEDVDAFFDVMKKSRHDPVRREQNTTVTAPRRSVKPVTRPTRPQQPMVDEAEEEREKFTGRRPQRTTKKSALDQLKANRWHLDDEELEVWFDGDVVLSDGTVAREDGAVEEIPSAVELKPASEKAERDETATLGQQTVVEDAPGEPLTNRMPSDEEIEWWIDDARTRLMGTRQLIDDKKYELWGSYEQDAEYQKLVTREQRIWGEIRAFEQVSPEERAAFVEAHLSSRTRERMQRELAEQAHQARPEQQAAQEARRTTPKS